MRGLLRRAGALASGLLSPKPIVRFACHIGAYHISFPVVQAAATFPEWARKQGGKKFAKCPGMLDGAREGYLIRAPYDIDIMANTSGCEVRLGCIEQDRQRLSKQAFDFSIVEGLPPIRDDVARVACKLPMPWAVLTRRGWSAHVIPAQFHSPFLGDLFVYGGVVDYEEFHTLNFVFTPLRKGEIRIPAGTPLLQVIPFKREVVTASCGRATHWEHERAAYAFYSRAGGLYRRVFHRKKSYEMETQDESTV